MYKLTITYTDTKENTNCYFENKAEAKKLYKELKENPPMNTKKITITNH